MKDTLENPEWVEKNRTQLLQLIPEYWVERDAAFLFYLGGSLTKLGVEIPMPRSLASENIGDDTWMKVWNALLKNDIIDQVFVAKDTSDGRMVRQYLKRNTSGKKEDDEQLRADWMAKVKPDWFVTKKADDVLNRVRGKDR